MLIISTALLLGIIAQGFVIAENHDTAVCDSNNLDLCLDLTTCEDSAVGGFWYNNTCNANAEAICDSNNLNLCLNQTDCETTGVDGFWYNETCNSEAEPVCDSNNLNLCLNQTDCETAGVNGFWYNNTCNANAEATCDSNNLNLCLNQTDCEGASGVWNDTTTTCEEAPATCDADNLNLCDTQETCEAEGGEWDEDNTPMCTSEDEEDDGNGQFASKEHQRIKFTARTGVECPTGCKCTGVVMKCPLEGGAREMTIFAGSSGKIIVHIMGVNMTTNVTLYIGEDGTTLTGVFRGQERKIKYLPDQAKGKIEEKIKSEIEEEEIELDEDGVYQVKAKKKARLFFLFSIKEGITTQVDSETGFVGKVKGPWWGFLARDNKLSQ